MSEAMNRLTGNLENFRSKLSLVEDYYVLLKPVGRLVSSAAIDARSHPSDRERFQPYQ